MASRSQAIALVEAANRLLSKYPVLAQFNDAISLIRPRYSADFEDVGFDSLDRRGSMIGGLPFISDAFPVPDGYDAPLLQLDLDDASDTVGEDVGSGLLQVWMPIGLWGSESVLGDHYVRVIPRTSIARTKRLLGHPRFCRGRWTPRPIVELKPLEGWIIDKIAKGNFRNPGRMTASDIRELNYTQHYWDGMDGFDWTLSIYSDEDYWCQRETRGTPLQLVGWVEDGYAVPPEAVDGAMWDFDYSFLEQFPDFESEADYRLIRDGGNQRDSSQEQGELVCGLFECYSDFYNAIYGRETLYGDDAKNWQWKPLIAFQGPLSGVTNDAHMIFFRETNSGYEYAGAGARWNY